ncbi:MAG: carboxymuconolactone decarboxylase family protein [Chloroflexota bacterium]
MDSQIELNRERQRLVDKFAERLPDTRANVVSQGNVAFADGAVPGRIKRLMGLAMALHAGCTNCILGRTTQALDEGATTEEVLETISVAVTMGGTLAMAESLRVLRLLEEMGRL